MNTFHHDEEHVHEGGEEEEVVCKMDMSVRKLMIFKYPGLNWFIKTVALGSMWIYSYQILASQHNKWDYKISSKKSILITLLPQKSQICRGSNWNLSSRGALWRIKILPWSAVHSKSTKATASRQKDWWWNYCCDSSVEPQRTNAQLTALRSNHSSLRTSVYFLHSYVNCHAVQPLADSRCGFGCCNWILHFRLAEEDCVQRQ